MRVAHFTMLMAIIIGAFGVFYVLSTGASLPEGYFAAGSEKHLTGTAQLWRVPRGGASRIVVFLKDGGDVVIDCFPIKKLCDTYSVGQKIGIIDFYGYAMSGRVYWPDMVKIDGTRILSKDESKKRYSEFRRHELSVANFPIAISIISAIISLLFINRKIK